MIIIQKNNYTTKHVMEDIEYASEANVRSVPQ